MNQLATLTIGTLVAAGVAVCIWVLAARRLPHIADPMAEVDRRINELEGSLHRLHDSFDHAVGS